jgi:hypothetical protein
MLRKRTLQYLVGLPQMILIMMGDVLFVIDLVFWERLEAI